MILVAPYLVHLAAFLGLVHLDAFLRFSLLRCPLGSAYLATLQLILAHLVAL